jgi:Cof subfamily protein (haloacid dehalogenase superfamily)
VSRPRLIVTDLDGTFLGSDRLVSPTNLAAARRAAELGIPFMVATGRPVRWLDVLDQLAEAHSQVIVSNGAGVFDLATRQVVRSFPLDAAVALAVADSLRAVVPGITFGFESSTGFGCEPTSPSRQRGAPGVLEGRLEDLVEPLGPVIKLLGFHTELDSDELSARAVAAVGDRLTLTHALVGDAYGMLELTAPGVTKASTLALLCAELGVAAADVVAFGDMPNDLAMLTWAGRGYVVANGHPSLHAAGFSVVPSNDEDGVGRTVLELLG